MHTILFYEVVDDYVNAALSSASSTWSSLGKRSSVARW